MKKLAVLAIVVGFAFLAPGCTLLSQHLLGDTGVKEAITLDWIKKGQTTKQELVDRFGPPSSCTSSSDGCELLVFEEKAVPWRELGLLAFEAGKVMKKMLTVRINKSGVVEDYDLIDIGKK